jgi:DNA adenine methylase
MIKSPLNFIGGKTKLLDQILPLFPTDIDNFIDLFGGGFNVGINVKAKNIIYYDKMKQLVEFFNYIKISDYKEVIKEIETVISNYKLSKTNKEGFLELRDYYNKENQDIILFYVLICYSFNHQIRFNNQGLFNTSFGKDRSEFNNSLKQKLFVFQQEIKKNNCIFNLLDFKDFDITNLNDNDFVYCDPPYLNSVSTHTENKGWTTKNEMDLLNLLDSLNKRKIKFALSNNLKYKNELLDKWKDKYVIHYLNNNYDNCNYHKKEENKTKDLEVLITNY